MKTVFNKSDVFTQLTIKDAEVYLNQKGFFANTLEDLETAARRNDYGILEKIYGKNIQPFKSSNNEYTSFSLFIPAEKVLTIDDKDTWSGIIQINSLYTDLMVSICNWALDNRKREGVLSMDRSYIYSQIEMIEDFKSHLIEQIIGYKNEKSIPKHSER